MNDSAHVIGRGERRKKENEEGSGGMNEIW